MPEAVLIGNKLYKPLCAVFVKLGDIFTCVMVTFDNIGKAFIIKNGAFHIKLKLIVFKVGKHIRKLFKLGKLRQFSAAYIEHVSARFYIGIILYFAARNTSAAFAA